MKKVLVGLTGVLVVVLIIVNSNLPLTRLED